MHSWVFRHRARLRVIYGPRPAQLPEAVAPPPAEHAGPAVEPPELPPRRAGLPAPGSVDRHKRHVLLTPMHRPRD